MSKFDPLRFIADHAGMALADAISEAYRQGQQDTESEIVRCRDCKYRIPYDWMFNEIWRSKNMNDYSEDEIGCTYCDMNMGVNDFCSRAERRADDKQRRN